MNRAYSILNVKRVDDEQRTITGIATTPNPDRIGDIVEPLGVKFSNPMPLLWQHRSDKPVGVVSFSNPTKDGIAFDAVLAKVEEPGTLKDRVDEAWQSVKAGLVRGVSIGFRSIESAFMKGGGIHFLKIEVMELSLVTIPANADATIHTIKSVDAPMLAASGLTPSDADRPTPPAPGKSKTVSLKERQPMARKSIAEQIAAYQATQVAKSARMKEIIDDADDKGETLDAALKEEYDGLKADIKEVDEHVARLKDMEAINLRTAAPVVTEGAAVSRADPIRVQVLPKKIEAGIPFVRYVMATALARGNPMHAVEIFKTRERWMNETPQVLDMLKVAVAAGNTTDTTWASPLVYAQNITEEFVEYLRPLTIIGRIPGLTRVPFKIRIPRQTGGATVNWVGEGAPKPITSLAFDSITMDFAKIAGIIVITEELARLSSPSAEMLVRRDLAAAIVQFMDSQFVDPTKAAVTGVSPASITNGVSPITATGTTGAALRADIKTLLSSFLTVNMSLSSAVFLMSQRLATAIGLMNNTLGQRQFPDMGPNGGTLLGIPVITSENIPSTGGSPTDGDPIILLSAADILLADDGQVTIDASREASLQMDTAPDSPATASTTMVSLWQQNQIGVRAERWINWAKRRSTAVAFIQNAKYFE